MIRDKRKKFKRGDPFFVVKIFAVGTSSEPEVVVNGKQVQITSDSDALKIEMVYAAI